MSVTGYLHVCFVENNYDECVEDECGQDNDWHDEPIDWARQLGRPGPHATVDVVANVFIVALPKRVQLKSIRKQLLNCLG